MCRISAPVRAKYGDESQFFDLDVSGRTAQLTRFLVFVVLSGPSLICLQDLENSAGSWDLYGTEDERRYPGLQAEFFQRAAAPLRRREALFGFVGVGEHLTVEHFMSAARLAIVLWLFNISCSALC